MSQLANHTDPTRREALNALANMPVEELRRLAHQLESEQKVIKALLRERTRRPDRGLALVGAAGEG
jgi:hypothetical protein